MEITASETMTADGTWKTAFTARPSSPTFHARSPFATSTATRSAWSVVTTTADTPVAQAALTMFQRRIGSLPVVADARLVGILTERDVLAGLRKEHGVDAEAAENDLLLW